MASNYACMLVCSLLLISTLRLTFADPKVTLDLQCHETHFNATFTVDAQDSSLYLTRRNMTATLKDDSCFYSDKNTPASYAADSNFTLHISMELSEGCGTTYTDNENHIFVNQTILLRVTDTLRNGVSQRVFYYSYEISCQTDRSLSVVSPSNYTVDKAVVVTKNESKADIYNIEMTMRFYSDHRYNEERTGIVSVGIDDFLFVEIAPVTGFQGYKFVLHSCEALDQLSYSSATIRDTFYFDKCPYDPTFEITRQVSDEYQFRFQAFSFPTSTTGHIFLKCQLHVCRQTDVSNPACTYSNSFGNTCSSGKRRDVTTASMETSTSRQITLVSKIKLKTDKTCTDIICGANSKCKELQPAVCICDDDYVFSRLQKKCIKERITQINKIHLDQEWNPEYLESNSDAFYRLAFKYEVILYKSFRAAGIDHIIEGVRVIKASKGSVILEVNIIYAVESSPVESYNYFVESIKAKSRTATNIRKDLKLLSDIKPEIVKIHEKMSDIPRLTLIITIVVMLLLFLLAGVILIVVRRRRNQAPITRGNVTGFNSYLCRAPYNSYEHLTSKMS